jgi:transposase
MRRVIGIDIHRIFGEVVMWEEGKLRSFGRVDMTRTALEGLGWKLHPTDEVVIEATGNAMAVSRVLSPNRTPGGTCSRRAALRHEVARASHK